jgi:hypothetical protein
MRNFWVRTMTESSRPLGANGPTADQIDRFAKLTVEQRFHWLVDMLAVCYELTPPEARALWRERDSK